MMSTALTRVFNSRNISHVSRLFISPSALLSTKTPKSSFKLWQNVHKLSSRQTEHRLYATETNKSKLSNLFPLLEEQDKESEEEEAKRREEEKQKQWKRMKLSYIIMGSTLSLMGTILFIELSRPSYDEKGNLIEDEFSHLPFFEQRIKRFMNEINYFKKCVQEPSREKLLPDPLKYPYIQPPYTIVLELKDLLVHPDWTYQTGWRFKKRPGVDQFLEALAPPKFELVVYTAEQGANVFPILDILDSQGYIMYRLVRDATRFVDGHHVKDLDCLNRDLSKVIVVDWDTESVKFHPDNLLKLPRWTGNDDDTTLYDLAAFLRTIYSTEVEDVRDVLRYYKEFDNPLQAFRENQRKLLEQMEEQEMQAKKQQQNKFSAMSWKPSFLNKPI